MIHIYTDGSFNAAAETGGWAALVEEEGRHRVVQGKEAREGRPTSNRMEITAAIRGLEATPPGATSTVHSDSQYVVFTMTRGWKRKVNHDLWAELDRTVGERNVSWEWVRGHTGHVENERADRLAVAAAEAVRDGRPCVFPAAALA